MSSTFFSLTNPDHNQDKICFFRIGLPFPKGVLSATSDVCLKDRNTVLADIGYEVIQLWEDGSVKWLSVFGLHQLEANATHKISVSEISSELVPLSVPVKVDDESLRIELNDGARIAFSTNRFCDISIRELESKFCINNVSNLVHQKTKTSHKLFQSNGVFSAVVIEQTANVKFEGKTLELTQKSTVFLSDGTIKTEFTFNNPSAALHPNGQWDLGDPNSLYISEIGISINKPASTIKTSVINDNGQAVLSEISDFTTCSVVQLASGEKNYDCANHVDASGNVPQVFNGYQITRDNNQTAKGKQCTPTVLLSGQHSKITLFVSVDKFWQKFPCAIRVDSKHSTFSLLGAVGAPKVELQPGEQGSRSIFISPTDVIEAHVTLCKQSVIASNAIPFLPTKECTDAFNKMMYQGIEGKHSFFNKRIAIDEFGWRHFGELYADHEKALQPETEHFVSHYNNQYDPIQGMLYQWIVSGDQRWFELADDLAKHVSDIDIYHTQEDKPEYSGGLFWHTDHYVQAYRATHRTYSSDQPSNVYDDHAGGGGPGGQHCYTTGLLLHYLLTGYVPSRDSVVSQSTWISNYYEGDNTLLSALLAYKNAGTQGLKNVKTGKYPLDRGTGNYINALLDKFEITGDSTIIQQCEHIIKNTVSPTDNLVMRHFENVEATWFYTVFLQAMCKYIAVKERQNSNDTNYHYAVAALIHYAKWMAENEYAYLDKPDILEFPNQTWSGQDIRKLCVLNFARAYVTEEWLDTFDRKLESLEQKIIDRLSASDEAKTTRLLCLMMQNVNYATYRYVPIPKVSEGNISVTRDKKPLLSLVTKTLASFSIGRERRQLVKRFPQLQKWLGQP